MSPLWCPTSAATRSGSTAARPGGSTHPVPADALATALAAVLADGRAGAVERREVVMARGHWPTNRGLFLDAVDRALAVAR